MKRRGVTVLLGAVLVGILLAGILSAPVPYVILGAGPTVDTVGGDDGKPIIAVTGAPTSESAGQLRLTTVGVQARTDLIAAIGAWFDRSRAVVPREMIYPAGRDEKEVDQQNAEDFKESQTSAETVALRELGYPAQTVVANVVADSPAASALRNDDVIIAIDGTPIEHKGQLIAAVQDKPAGAAFAVRYRRDGKEATATITSRADGKDKTPRIGVEVSQRQPKPFTITIKVAEDIGGPSAGLMFALGIIDKLRPEDLTGGKSIAGTGTIDDGGNVGPIGGIPQKLVGARAAGARYFLAPADNCAEAKASPVPGLTVARVATIDDALAALAAIREGRDVAGC
ncbi:YlbL family protein [Pilimelia columellifera]|uniref:endopeptidase La n=1 Tax=Pilimelia columellifera subsp. columellifera TaxID=706583 RepID=A0ABN3N6J6_9ACTN